MKIALIGYGKMGKEIEKLLSERGHTVVAKVNSQNPLTPETIKDTDVAIEFSTPSSVLDNIKFLISHKVPVIVGTTGWNNHLEKVTNWVNKNDASLVYASNFSIGVNLFFKLNEQLSKLMNPYKEYQASITEIHH